MRLKILIASACLGLSACSSSAAPSTTSSTETASTVPRESSAAAAMHTWHGKLDQYSSVLSFSVQASRVLNFTVPEASADCMTGFTTITVNIPSASLEAGRISGGARVNYDGETEFIDLDGRVDGHSASGAVRMRGPCHASFTWTAHQD